MTENFDRSIETKPWHIRLLLAILIALCLFIVLALIGAV